MTSNAARIAQFVHLFLFTLVVGVFWGTWFSLSRSIESISPPTFLEVGHTMIANLGGPMAVLMPAALLSALPVLTGLHRRRRRRGFYLNLAGGALLLCVPDDHVERQCPDRSRNRAMDGSDVATRIGPPSVIAGRLITLRALSCPSLGSDVPWRRRLSGRLKTNAPAARSPEADVMGHSTTCAIAVASDASQMRSWAVDANRWE